MKHVLSLLLVCIICFSCNDDLQDNTPSIQGIQNGEILWKASGYTVSGQGGTTIIRATTTDSTLELSIPNIGVGTYVLGSSSSAVATFTEDGTVYSTTNDGMGSPVFVSDGEIVIESLSGSSITGTFMFNAYDESGQLTVNFIDGVVFKIPLYVIINRFQSFLRISYLSRLLR